MSAWQQCYEYFGRLDCEFEPEIAGLRLAFYLANFGMFRASGKTRELQLTAFSRLAEIARAHVLLRDKTPGELAVMQEEVTRFLERLRKGLRKVDVSPTHTLVTKIALATTSCVPAYDRYVVRALKDNGLVGAPSERGLTQLYRLHNNLGRFAPEDSTLPYMRSLDIELMKRGQAIRHTKP